MITCGSETIGPHETDGDCTHINGRKFDFISNDGSVDAYIASNFERKGDRGDDPRYKKPGANIFYILENNNHWDVEVNCAKNANL